MAIPDYICGSKYENMNINQVMMVVGSQVKSVRIPGHFFKTPHMSLFCSGTVLESAWNLAIFHSEQQEQWGKKKGKPIPFPEPFRSSSRQENQRNSRPVPGGLPREYQGWFQRTLSDSMLEMLQLTRFSRPSSGDFRLEPIWKTTPPALVGL